MLELGPAGPSTNTEDTALLTNSCAGLSCTEYVAEKFCALGSGVLETWAAGADRDMPEDNCCACGKHGKN
jgi:hypothetical protein